MASRVTRRVAAPGLVQPCSAANPGPAPVSRLRPLARRGRAVAFGCSAMCDFLTIIVPMGSEPRLSRWRRRGFDLSESSNSSIQAHLPPGQKQWLLTSSGCSCELVKHAKATPDLIGLRADVPEVLDELLGENQAGFILVHTYSGDTATEEVVVCQAPSMTIAAIRSAEHRFMRDHLIPVVRQTRQPTMRSTEWRPRDVARQFGSHRGATIGERDRSDETP